MGDDMSEKNLFGPFALLIVTLVLTGCLTQFGEWPADSSVDGDADTDNDADVEGDGDADVDVDGDVDGDADGDDDTDGDIDIDADADIDGEDEPECGNRVTEAGEECDDGHGEPDDGCDNDCHFSCYRDVHCDDGNQCTVDTCDEVSGGKACAHIGDDGADCSDDNPCTEGDACDETSACVSGPNTCECDGTADCAVHEDGNLCNGTLACVAGHCYVAPETIVECDASDDTDCQTNTCAPLEGTCSMVLTRDDTPCVDGDFCTPIDTCLSGLCVGTGNPCAECQICNEDEDRCDTDVDFCFIDGICYEEGTDNTESDCQICDSTEDQAVWTNKADGTSCEDGDPCTATDTCDGAGSCVSPPILPSPAVPAPLSPENGARTGSLWAPESFNTLRPLFRWVHEEDSCGAVTYDIQIDESCAAANFRACAFPTPLNMTDLTETSFRPGSDLSASKIAPVGTRYYWHVRVCRRGVPCSSWSAVRYIDVGRVPKDFDGDGYSDVVVGAPGSGGNPGQAFVFYGRDGAVSGDPDVHLRNPAPEGGHHFGVSVASAGDVDGDGYADLIVGAYEQSLPTRWEGNAFLYYGGPDGIHDEPDVTLDNPDEGMVNGFFGISVASAGDVDGDGYADLIVGASGQRSPDSPESQEGNAFLYYGSTRAVFDPEEFVRFDNPDDEHGGLFGWSVASAGDVDGDGYDDILVGAYRQDHREHDEGNVFLYYGSARDVFDPEEHVRFDNPDDRPEGFFGFSVASAGDTNCDGYADIVIQAPRQTDTESRAFVYYGGESRFRPIVEVSSITLDHPADYVLPHNGSYVASAGDVNGDGCADVIVGVGGRDTAEEDEGNVFLYYGREAIVADSVAPDIIYDNPTDEVGGGFGVVGSAGDIDGDGYADVVIGAPGQEISYQHDGSAFVYFGPPSDIDPVPDVTLNYPDRGRYLYFGAAVASIGDRNNEDRAPSPDLEPIGREWGVLPRRRGVTDTNQANVWRACIGV